MRGRGIGRDSSQGVDLAEGTVLIAAAGSTVARIEASLEPDLKPNLSSGDLGDDRAGGGEVQRDGLLAEDRDPGLDRCADEVGMGGGRGRDDHAIQWLARSGGKV